MSLYENVFIARQDVSQVQVDELTETFEKIITDHDGAVKKTEQWGLRSLAYKIKKNRKGYYVLFNIDAPSAAILEMERQMHINEDVLRFLTTRVDELEEGPSAVLRARDRDDDRGRRGPRDFDKKPNVADKKPSEDKAPDTEAKTSEKKPGEEKPGEEKKEEKTEPKEKAAADKTDDAEEKSEVTEKSSEADKASEADKQGEDK